MLGPSMPIGAPPNIAKKIKPIFPAAFLIMKRYITHQFPNELKTYALLTLASVLTVVAVTFFLSISGFSQHVFKTFIVEHPVLNFIITPITFVVIIYFAKQYCHCF
jgi:hypothetical protein